MRSTQTDATPATIDPEMGASASERAPASPDPSGHPIRIALVDDEDSMHLLLRNIFKKHVKAWTMDSYRDGQRALDTIPQSPPDAVLMDIRLPGLTGIECARNLKNILPAMPVVMLSAHVDPEMLLNSMMAGASGCLFKPASGAEIVKTLKKTMTGSVTFCARAEKTLMECFYLLEKNCQGCQLSSREQEIMTFLCHQKTDKQIAESLGISTGTVHVHVSSIFKKLCVHNRAEAINKIMRVNRLRP